MAVIEKERKGEGEANAAELAGDGWFESALRRVGLTVPQVDDAFIAGELNPDGLENIAPFKTPSEAAISGEFCENSEEGDPKPDNSCGPAVFKGVSLSGC